ncbi:hypothetical protein CANCADRAFT_12272, partial [Tortispora caseinolytica NRRL Y-17796]
MRIVSFNICGIRSVLSFDPWRQQKSFEHMFDVLDADIVCFQETKIQQRDLTVSTAKIKGFDCFYTFAAKRGYSGVSIYIRSSKLYAIKAEEGLTGYLGGTVPYRDQTDSIGGYPDIDPFTAREIDSEGRALVIDVGYFVLIGLYCPADSMGTKSDFRKSFFEILDLRVRNLIRQGKSVVVLGDINIIRDEIDTADPAQNMKQNGISSFKQTFARSLLDQLLFPHQNGVLHDLCRHFHPQRKGMFTCWNTLINARPSNYGSRIDYIFCSDDLLHAFTNADIRPDLNGSDHCPIYADFDPDRIE